MSDKPTRSIGPGPCESLAQQTGVVPVSVPEHFLHRHAEARRDTRGISGLAGPDVEDAEIRRFCNLSTLFHPFQLP